MKITSQMSSGMICKQAPVSFSLSSSHHLTNETSAMLFLLLLVHTLPISGRPVPAQHLVSRALSTGSCDDINNCRRLVDIVWGCLATIFACTWVSIHPNVPPPNQTRLGLFWRRLRMMLIAVVAPELMVGFAARQFFTARWYSKRECY
jgi:hypothetical protein